MAEAHNASENIRFSRYVKAKVQDILGMPQDEPQNEARKEEVAEDCVLNFRNECGRRAMSGDVVMFKEDHFIVVPRDKRKDWQADGYTPVGVYVIASNGETGMLSLVNMSWETPETGDVKGNADGRFIRYGGYGSHVDGLKSYDNDEARQKVLNRQFEVVGHARYGYLPSDKFENGSGAKAQVKGKYFYDDDDNLLPPPFNADGTPNPLFGQGNDAPSFLSDNDSRANTDALIKDVTKQEDWMTAEKIINVGDNGYHPAACCCRRFHTVGTKAGDWDMPTIPVLASAFCDWNAVQGTLEDLAKDGLAVPLNESRDYWSSSEYSQDGAYYLNTYIGRVGSSYKDFNYLVLAFRRLPRI